MKYRLLFLFAIPFVLTAHAQFRAGVDIHYLTAIEHQLEGPAYFNQFSFQKGKFVTGVEIGFASAATKKEILGSFQTMFMHRLQAQQLGNLYAGWKLLDGPKLSAEVAAGWSFSRLRRTAFQSTANPEGFYDAKFLLYQGSLIDAVGGNFHTQLSYSFGPKWQTVVHYHYWLFKTFSPAWSAGLGIRYQLGCN